MGFQFNQNTFLFSIEAYQKEVNGIITPSQGFQDQYQYVYSIGKYAAQGIDILFTNQFKDFNIWSNYSLAKNNYDFEGFIPPNFPNNIDVKHILSIGGSYKFKHIEFSSGFNFRTGKPYTKPSTDNNNNSDEIIYEESNSSRLENYTRLDVSAKYNFNVRQVKGVFGLSVWNVLNRKNVINTYYQRNDTNQIEQVTRYALGITPNINLRLTF